MKKVILIVILLTNWVDAITQPVHNYTVNIGYCVASDSLTYDTLVALRKFVQNNDTCYFVVDPLSLKTSVVKAMHFWYLPASWMDIVERYYKTPYVKALLHVQNNADSIQDAGFHKFLSTENGINLTVDLCPSHKPLDRIVFTELIAEFGKNNSSVPVALSVSGKWMSTHDKDLTWLCSLADSNKLSIVWVNHSYNHYTKKDAPITQNFLLEKGTNISSEVLRTESYLIQKGLTPSVFFRFPGLVSNREVFECIIDYGLIPIGCDAWLAKGQSPQSGSIVLIHANGNEPLGVKEFCELLKKKRQDVAEKKWQLYDLRESTVSEWSTISESSDTLSHE